MNGITWTNWLIGAIPAIGGATFILSRVLRGTNKEN